MIIKDLKIVLDKYGPEPVYLQIKNRIGDYIRERDVPAGTRIPSINDIALSAGVSLRTAERGLKELIRENICYRRPKFGTFVADTKKPVSDKKVCGIISHRTRQQIDTNLISAMMYQGITSAAEKRNIDLFIISGDIENSLNFYCSRKDLRLKGVIIFNSEDIRPGMKIAKKFPEIQFVELNYQTRDFDTSPKNVIGVFNDDFAGAYQIISLMLERGHRHFGLISLPEPTNDNYENRLEGYRMALKNSGLKTTEKIIYVDFHNKNITQQQLAWVSAKKLLAAKQIPDCIMCVNDLLAEGVVTYLKEHSPNNVEVCGYDNILSDISERCNFSTIAVDFKAMGEKAVDTLDSPERRYPKIIRIHPHLIIREHLSGA